MQHSDRFWKHYFMSERFVDSLRTVTYGIRDGRSINVDEFMDSILTVPEATEQKQIGKLFDELDSLITLHKREPPLSINWAYAGYQTRAVSERMTRSTSLFSSSWMMWR